MVASQREQYLNKDLYDQFNTALGSPGQGDSYIDTFRQKYKEQTGKDADTATISNFIKEAGVQAASLPGDLGYNDISGLATNYIQDKFGKDIQGRSAQEAPGQYDAVNQMFQSSLGREATQEEKDHFGGLLASKNIDSYQLQDFLKQQPEYTSKQDAAFRGGLSNELQGYDKNYYENQIMPAIQSSYAKQGRSFDSSGFQNALGQAAGQQNTQREQYLAQLSASQYGNQQGNARQDYLSRYAQATDANTYNRDRTNMLSDQSTARMGELQNYQIQQNAYEQYLRKYGKRSSGLGGMIGTAVGTGLGAYAGGPAGAQAGAQIGGSFGNYFG